MSVGVFAFLALYDVRKDILNMVTSDEYCLLFKLCLQGAGQ